MKFLPLTQILPQRTLGRMRILHQLRCCVEAHGCPALQVLLRPAWIAARSKTYPGRMHGVSNLLRGIVSQEVLHFSDIECIEDERDFQAMARAQASIELG